MTVKSSAHAQSATSLPRAPRDEASSRSVRYLITMGIRILCFVLMVVITPYGWYTWVFGAAAVFLPYIAVVIANVGSDVRETGVENPERALPAAAEKPAPAPSADAPTVIRLHETPAVQPPREPEA
jgi:hypothetical protein